MKVIPVSTRVVTKIGSMKGIITAISIRGQGYVSYAISYFHQGVYSEIWLMDFEFEVDTQTKAGFGNKPQQEVTLIELK
jgi:hypothetical protein